jgi:hypothetical protein
VWVRMGFWRIISQQYDSFKSVTLFASFSHSSPTILYSKEVIKTKQIILVLLMLLLAVSVYADTTFFDNQDDFFLMDNPAVSSPESPGGGGGVIPLINQTQNQTYIPLPFINQTKIIVDKILNFTDTTTNKIVTNVSTNKTTQFILVFLAVLTIIITILVWDHLNRNKTQKFK